MSAPLIDGIPAISASSWAVALPAQAPTPSPGPDRGEEFGKSGPIGLVVILVFAVVVILLIRSMNKHLRKVPESFDRPVEPDRADEDGSS